MNTQQSSGERQSDKTKTSGKGEGLVDQAADTMRGAVDQASDLAERTMAKGREAAATVQEVSGTMKGAIDTSLKHQPMATLAVVAAFGFLLGALWKS
jgi:ElaB/YqjD/DUF883 family membrane-anchored ribosome-binding protein